MTRHSCRFVEVRVLVLVAGLAAVIPVAGAHGQVTRSWAINTSGTAGTAANWNPAGVPAALDDLFFARPFAYTVTFGAAVPVTHWMWVEQGAVTLRFNSPHTNTYGFRTYGGSVAVFDLGSFTSPSVSVPYSPGFPGAGAIEVAGSGTTMNLGVGSGHPAYGPLEALDNGTITIRDGADVTSTRGLVGSNSGVAAGANRPSLLTVTGAGSTLDIHTAASTGDLTLGAINQACSLEVLAGASVACDKLALSTRDNTTNNVTVSGASTFTVRGDATVGANGAPATGTTTNITVNSAATMTIGGVFADNPGYSTSGLLQVGGTFETGALRSNLMDMRVVDNGVARVIAQQGNQTLLRVAGVTVDGSAAGQLPELVLNGSGFGALDIECNFTVGNFHGGSLDVRDGTFLAGGRFINLGENPGASGSLLVRPGAELRVDTVNVARGGIGAATINGTLGANHTTTLRVGTDGIGTLGATGSMSLFALDIGDRTSVNPSAMGTVTLTGSDCSTHLLFLGGNYGSPVSNLNVESGATLTMWDQTVGDLDPAQFIIDESGQVTVDAATIDATSYALGIECHGHMALADGTVIGRVAMTASPRPDWPRLSGSGSVDGIVDTTSDSLIDANAGAPLRIGPVGGTFQVLTNSGRMRSVAASTLVVRHDAMTNAAAATVELDNGTFKVNGTCTNSGSITGNGTVDADLINLGSITPNAGTVLNGIRFLGDVSQAAPGSMQGSRVTFADTSTFSGAGGISADLISENGSTIGATGQLNLGVNGSPTGIDLRGTLNCNGNFVRLRDGNGALVNTTGVVNLGTNGTVEALSGLVLSAGSVLRGSGSVTANVTSLGRVAPGGTISVSGDYLQASVGPIDGEFALDISGASPGQYDVLNVSGNVALNGLLSVTLNPSYMPQAGDTITFITAAGSRTGTFGAISLANNPGGVVWTLDYLPHSVRARVVSVGPVCDSIDFNNDSLFPDTQDISDFLTVFAGGVCAGQAPNDPPCNTDIDFNNDGLLPDVADIDAFISVFAGGACL